MNPQEVPQAYDLTKIEDTQKLFNGLTLAEKNTLREKFTKEKQAIIYLTKSEVQSLQDTLSASGNVHMGTRVERVANFLEQQKAEGLSLAELAGSESPFTEVLKTNEALVDTMLYGPEGIFKDISLSPQAQEVFATGMNLAIIAEMGKTPPGIDLTGLMKTPQDVSSLEALVGKMLPLGVLAQQKETISTPAGNKEVSKLDISGSGDTNTLFQDPLKAQEFIVGILSGTISADKIESKIESQNDTAAQNIDVGKIQETLQTHLGALEKKLSEAQAAARAHETTPGVGTGTSEAAAAAVEAVAPNATEEEKQGFLAAFLKFFKEFVDGFIAVGEKVFGPLEPKAGNTGNETTGAATIETPDILDLHGKIILITQTGVSQQIGDSVKDIQKPSTEEVSAILKEFQNKDFSDQKNHPENSARAIYALQVALSSQGIDVGNIDGVFGPKTLAGIKKYQKSIGLGETGNIDTPLFSTLIEKITPKAPKTPEK